MDRVPLDPQLAGYERKKFDTPADSESAAAGTAGPQTWTIAAEFPIHPQLVRQPRARGRCPLADIMPQGKAKKPSAKQQAAAAQASEAQEKAAAAFGVSLADLNRLNEVSRCLPAFCRSSYI